MRSFIYGILIILILELLTFRCANPVSPTGGPKDTIPPNLISSVPAAEQILFKDKEVTLVFDEFINADKLKQNLIITPFYDGKYKTLIKKSKITLRFEEYFNDSTTYTFNFANGITDITERTPPDNLTLSFSTGSYIDSLKIIGSMRSLLSGQLPKDKFNISLYKLTDSLDIATQKPTYFTKSLESGQFEIKNIKSGTYILIAFNDKNNNLQLDASVESHALIADTILPVFSPDSLYLRYIDVDASKLKFISARPSAQYFDIRYSKPITKFRLTPFQHAKIVSENQVLRIYQDSTNLFDSLQVVVQTSDTVNNTLLDTLYVKFKESQRAIDEFKVTSNVTSTTSNTLVRSLLNKPGEFNQSQVSIQIDTISSIAVNIDSAIHNNNFTKYSSYLNFNKIGYQQILDSLLVHYFPDTTGIDSLSLVQYNYLSRLNTNSFTLRFKKGAFYSIQNDSSKVNEVKGQFYNPENYGTITVNTKTDHDNYEVHIVDSKQKTAARIKNCKTCLFTGLRPAEYSVRIFVDVNNDGYWDPGNILTLSPPEPIINFQEFTDLRANWAIELNYEF